MEVQTELKTPSAFQIGERVDLNFHKGGKLSNVEITAVKFRQGTVYYDVAIDVSDAPEGYTIIEGVHSGFVTREGVIE